MPPAARLQKTLIGAGLAFVSGLALLSACTSLPPPAEQQAPPPTTTAPATPAQLRPVAAELRHLFTTESLAAFHRACPAILRRTDASGLTTTDDWRPACNDRTDDPVRFFQQHFTALQLDDGRGLVTGYYEPEIRAHLDPQPGAIPILTRPTELVEFNLADWGQDGGRLAGVLQDGRIRPAPDRAAIDQGALSNTPALAWTQDRIGFFFLQIQGSGVLRLDDGQRLRIGYAGHNGHDYVAIGRLLKERGELTEVSMASIHDWLQQNPKAGIRLMQENPRYIFMRRLSGNPDGPIGALGVPLLPRVNVAVDPALLPYGTPIAITTTDQPQPLELLAIAADTGAAIKGPNRFDIFFGAGNDAAAMAGYLAARSQAVILLPKPAAARLQP